MGDVNGIGPEILVKALAHPQLWAACHPVVIGDIRALESVQAFAPQCPPFRVSGDLDFAEGSITVIQPGPPMPAMQPGRLTAEAGHCAVEWLKYATQLAIDGQVAGIVTCPLNKKGIQLAGYHYAGHTEIISEMTGSPESRMSLFSSQLRIVHISAHIPLAAAINQVRTDRITETIRIAHEALLRLGLPQRRIAVAGLNPHAGEETILGMEEDREIAPAVNQCQMEGIECTGPYPPDTIFLRAMRGEFDLVVAMYHDQGHVPFKMVAMDEGVNITLGIPIVRTSVDHGTAYDIAGKGVANEGSLLAAIELAAQFAQSRSDATSIQEKA